MKLIVAAAIALAAAAWGFFMIQNRKNPVFLAKFAPKVLPEDYPSQYNKILIQGAICFFIGILVLVITYIHYSKP